MGTPAMHNTPVHGSALTGFDPTRFSGSCTARTLHETLAVAPTSSGIVEMSNWYHPIDAFKAALDERWSYRYANDADFESAIESLRARKDIVSQDGLGIELQKVIALGIDGHAGVIGHHLRQDACLPFQLASVQEKIVAYTQDPNAYLLEGYPFLTKIDGVDIDSWLVATSALVPNVTPQFLRHRCLRLLRELNYWREVLNLPKKDVVGIELADEGDDRRTLTLQATESPPTNVMQLGESRVLEGNIGYLRLVSMQKAVAIPEIRQWMPKFRDCNALVIDVRDNRGGDCDGLNLLFSYLSDAVDAPRIQRAAAYRLHPAYKEDHLARLHYMYPGDSGHWTDQERQSISDFRRTFVPEFDLREGQFSDWHYTILRPSDDFDVYYWNKPAVLLMNGISFSASDLLLSALKGLKNVQLVGTPSGGGSGFPQVVDLPETDLKLQVSSMASFQASGDLFDGHGVQPDTQVDQIPEFYIGGRDAILDRAVKRL